MSQRLLIEGLSHTVYSLPQIVVTDTQEDQKVATPLIQAYLARELRTETLGFV